MSRRPAFLALVAAVLVVLATAHAAAAAPCRNVCTVQLPVGPHPRTWESPQRFGPQATVAVNVFDASGRELRRRVTGHCTGVYTGYGFRVGVNLCGRGPAPLTVRARAKRPGAVVIAYEGR